MRNTAFGAVGAQSLTIIFVNTALATQRQAQSIRQLDSSWIPQILRLQAKASDGQTIMRDRAYMERLFAASDIVLGITNNQGELIAQATTRLNIALPAILQDHFNTASGATAQPGNHAIIGCVTVHPDYRGRGLMGELMRACLAEAGLRGAGDIHARVKCGNEASKQNFIKYGFDVIATDKSPEDPSRIVDFLHLKL